MRHDNLLSQHLEVALVYKEMLGIEDAVGYLEQESIPKDIAERVLFSDQHRQPCIPAQAAPPRPPSCRRKNHVHDAIVEAALKIERKLGSAWALDLLRKEDVPEAVARRILADGPRQIRARSRAA